MKQHNYTTIAVNFDPFAQGEIEKTILLTEPQEEIWTACITGGAEASCSYNESLSLILRGDFQLDAMLQALQGVISRHEALRSTISADGELLCIHYKHSIDPHYEDLSTLPDTEQTKILENYGVTDAESPFDLKNAPLFRVAIFKLDEREHHIRLTAHHIVCDGWSFGIILEDLGALYTASVTGKPVTLEPAIGFSHYTSEMKVLENTIGYEKSLSYWTGKYTHEIPSLNLPFDHPRPAQRSHASFRKEIRLEEDTVTKIKQLGESLGASMTDVWIALFEVYLHKLTGQQEVVFGLPTSGQLATGNFNLVGHCVNLLPIKSSINPTLSFSDYLTKRKKELLNDYDHQLVGYSAISKALKIKQQKSTQPLISAFFNIDSCIGENIVFQELDYTIATNPGKFDIFDFSANLTRSLGEYVLVWSYNIGLFDHNSVERMADGFLRLLKDILKHPHDAVRTYNLANSKQRTVITQLNDTAFTCDKSQTAMYENGDLGKQLPSCETQHPFYRIPTIEPQQEIWLACELGGDNANNAYTVTFDQELTGPLQPDALHKAAQQLVDRHEMLRANLSEDGHELVIKRNADVDWTFRDLSDQRADQQALFIEREVQKHTDRVFDLKNDVLFTVFLYRFSEKKHRLILTTHHIVFDGWSYDAAMTELGIFYSAFTTNTTPKIDVPPRFSDYASEEHTYYQNSEHEAVKNFWLSRLEGELIPVELPTDYVRPKQRTYHSARASFLLSTERLDIVKQISKRANCSVSMALRSILEVFLYRMTGQADIITGMPAAGQLLTNREHLIGHCVNLLPVRTQIDGDTSFPDYLKLRKTQLLEEFIHQKITFSTLLPSLNIARDKARPPLISIVMNSGVWLDDGATLFHGLKNELKDTPKSFENFEIVLDAIEHADGMRMRWDYHTALFKPETIHAFHQRFEQIITQLGEKEEIKIDRISLVLPTEQKNYDELPVDKDDSLDGLFKKAVHQYADQIAVSSATKSITYRELDLKSSQLVNLLSKKGIKPGDKIGMALNRSCDAMIALLAIIKSGAAYLPLDLSHPQERINQIVNGASLKVVITEEQPPFSFPSVEKQFTIESLIEQATSMDTAVPQVRAVPNRIIYILHTSGSTGTPKGVCMGERALVNLLKWQMEVTTVTADCNTLQFSPLTFDVSFQEIFATLLAGGTLSLITDEARMDPEQLIQHIQNQSIHRLFLPFVALQSMADYATAFNHIPSSLIEVITAGEQLKITPQIASFFKNTGATLFNQYGPTETHVVTQFQLAGATEKWPALPPIGRPIKNTHILILNEQLVEEPPGVIGELCIAGVALADGYLNDPTRTAERFKSLGASASHTGIRIYKTGDLARRLPDGNIAFIGRKDAQVKLRGFRIELGEIEHVLTKQLGIQEAVVALQENGDTKQLIAYLVLQPGRKFEQPTVIEQLRKELPEYMVPTGWAIIPRIPLTKSGKVDRKALVTNTRSMEKINPGKKVAAYTETQEKLIQLWQSCLNVNDIGIRDDFFELGGHSLIAVKLMAQINRHLGIKFPLGSLFENSTVEQQARAIDEKPNPMKWDCLIPIKTDGSKPPLYFVHGALLDILYVRNLLPHLDPSQPLYGIQGMGLSGKSEAANSVEKIAAHYVHAILEQNPTGPYALAGFSSGGVLAFEMCKQLEKRGKQVHFLGLIDTFTPKLQFGGSTTWSGFYGMVIKEGIKQYTAKMALLFAGLLLVDTVLKNTIGKMNNRYKKLFPPDYWRSKTQLIHALAQRKYQVTPHRANAYLFRSPDEPGVTNLVDYETNGWGPIIGNRLTIIPVKHVHTQLFFPESVADVAEKIQQGIDSSWKNQVELASD